MLYTLVSLIKSLLAISSKPLAFLYGKVQRDISSNKLTVIDCRTRQQFSVPIVHDAIPAINFQLAGLKVLDPGFSNTAVMKSQITLM